MSLGDHLEVLKHGAWRFAGRLIGVCAVVMSVAGCTSERSVQVGASNVPIVTPSNAYEPFTYTSAAQRQTFQAYIRCAALHGVDLEGPFRDSTGQSIFFRLAPEESASRAQQAKVERACPQATVGLFGTPIGRVRIASFEQTATEFARCVRTHGYPAFELPAFVNGHPVTSFWKLPFRWSSQRFSEATRKCTDPLRNYLFVS